jgi:hypothetical protein
MRIWYGVEVASAGESGEGDGFENWNGEDNELGESCSRRRRPEECPQPQRLKKGRFIRFFDNLQ